MGIALRARYGQRLDLALANERQHRRGRRPVDVDAAAQHVGDDKRPAAVGNAGDIEPMPVIEIFGEELRHRPLGEAETELAGIGLGVGDEFGHRIGRPCALMVSMLAVRATNAIGRAPATIRAAQETAINRDIWPALSRALPPTATP